MRGFQFNSLNRDALKARLHQIGAISTVYVKEAGETDVLNNETTIFKEIGETILFAHWQSGENEDRTVSTGGFNLVEPTFIFPHDSNIEDDSHVFWNGQEYEVTATLNRGNHIVANGKQVKILTKSSGPYEVRDKNGDVVGLPVEP